MEEQPRSDAENVGVKRTSADLGEKRDLSSKRVKMNDLECVYDSQGAVSHDPFSTKMKGYGVQSELANVPLTLDLDASQAGKSSRKTLLVEVSPANGELDLNTEASLVKSPNCAEREECAENPDKSTLLSEHQREHQSNRVTSRGIGVDLNASDDSSSVNPDPFQSSKEHPHIKSIDMSECGSSAGPLEEKDALRIWKEMKKNGFLSSSHGGIPLPKQRGRKSKNDVFKKKMELAKREQINRFTKIAAPSGLLNELNPGIINHVRNRKQVHSIIEALVKSEKNDNGNVGNKRATHLANKPTDCYKKDLEHMKDAGTDQLTFSSEEENHTVVSESGLVRGFPFLQNSSMILEGQHVESDPCVTDRDGHRISVSDSDPATQDVTLAIKLPSAKVHEDSSLSNNDEASNVTSVSALSFKAARVASQWLELLHQDIKGRLSALRRSRRRVQAVITTELPLLLSKEFSYNQENDISLMKTSTACANSSPAADMHRTRWCALFDQMDKALSEEEKQLESWLNQVIDKQMLCDQGLQHVQWNVAYGAQHVEASKNDIRTQGIHGSDDLAVRAAAASLFSTCSFISSSENVKCC